MSTLRVIDGGRTRERERQDADDDAAARLRLAAEMADAAALCDELDDAGLQIAFSRRGRGGRSVQAQLLDSSGAVVRDVAASDVCDITALRGLAGLTG